MFSSSVVLAPAVGSCCRVGGGSVGGPFSLHRSDSCVMSQSYFLPMMGLFNAQQDRQESDNRGGESSNGGSASASGAHYHHGVNSRVSSAPRYSTQTARDLRGRPNHGPNMHVSSGIVANSRRSGQPSVMEEDSSRAIVEDYIRYCLEKQAIPWENGQRDVTPSAAQRAMRGLGDELEDRFSESINDMVSRLQFTPENGQEKLTTVMDEIFADGVAWGRLAALVEFAGKLSVQCCQQSRPQLVHSIVDWVSNYVDTRLRSWIVENNGWEGFVRFYEDPNKQLNESWSSLKKLFTVGAAAVGLLTLGALWKS